MFKQINDSRAETVTVQLNGNEVRVVAGTTVAAVALTAGLSFTRTTPVSGARRAPFCMMGVCYDCLMIIDGQSGQRACMTYVKEGMRIECQQGAGLIPGESQ